MADRILGIDLGTTNSEVAIVENGQPRIVKVDGSDILPSVVGIAEDGRLLIGHAARNQMVVAPERTVKSIKRKMGEDTKVTLGDQSYSPQEISALILKRLKQAAEEELGETFGKAVITVPAYFNDSQRQATREAGELAGLEVVRILNEPTAAALTYNPQAESERFLVYDLGGGTFDVSIVQAEGGVFEVLASNGDTRLGGDDFDELLLDHIAEEFLDNFGVDLRDNPATRARVLLAAEKAKKVLSDHPFARIEEEFIAEKDGIPLHLSIELERETFEELVKPLLNRTLDCLQKALDDARLTASQIDQVVLVGGSTRSPIIGQMLEFRLGQPAHKEVHPDLCVALGAATQAGMINGETVGSVLVDVTPHSLGIRSLTFTGFSHNEYHFSKIITRNTPLPVSRSEVYGTVHDSQQVVKIAVYQGEEPDVRQNHQVGEFSVEGLAKVPAGNQILVTLNLSLDGTLKVTAREKATGLEKRIVVENAITRFALEERDSAQRRLQQLWHGDSGEHEPAVAGDMPVLEAAVPEGQRELVRAKALLEKAEKLRENASPEDQEELDRMAERIRVTMADQDWAQLTPACDALSDVLFYLEDA